MNNKTNVVTLPARFVEDWLDCGLAPEWPDTDVEVSNKTARGVTLTLSDARLGDLLSRAEVYAVFDGSDFTENRGLCLSARAILKRFTVEQRQQYRTAFNQACG